MNRTLSIILLLAAGSAHAEIKMLDVVSVAEGIPAWIRSFSEILSGFEKQKRYPETGYAECAEIKEVKNVYLCLNDTQKNMNLAFLRASLFAEGNLGAPRETVLSQSDSRFRNGFQTICGHDLKRKDLIDFYVKAQAACEQSADYCLNPQESEIFSSLILPLANKSEDFVVISFSYSNDMPYPEVVSHEVLHAQYFMQPKFRETIDEFWANRMTDADRTKVKKILGEVYDTSNDYLMRNEFQAYLLESNADDGALGPLVPDFRLRLVSALKKAHSDPVQIGF